MPWRALLGLRGEHRGAGKASHGEREKGSVEHGELPHPSLMTSA
jgi:hypothetical protein